MKHCAIEFSYSPNHKGTRIAICKTCGVTKLHQRDDQEKAKEELEKNCTFVLSSKTKAREVYENKSKYSEFWNYPDNFIWDRISLSGFSSSHRNSFDIYIFSDGSGFLSLDGRVVKSGGTGNAPYFKIFDKISDITEIVVEKLISEIAEIEKKY